MYLHASECRHTHTHAHTDTHKPHSRAHTQPQICIHNNYLKIYLCHNQLKKQEKGKKKKRITLKVNHVFMRSHTHSTQRGREKKIKK